MAKSIRLTELKRAGKNRMSFSDILEFLAQIKLHFPELDLQYGQIRGSKTESFAHEAQVLYNLIEVHNPSRVYGLSYIDEKDIKWIEGRYSPKRFFGLEHSGKKGPDKIVEAVTPGIKIITRDGSVVFLGYQNAFQGLRPDFVLYYGFSNINLERSESKVEVFFDKMLTATISKSKDREWWRVTEDSRKPDIVLDAKENKKALTSRTRSNIPKYKEHFPGSKLIIICPEKIPDFPSCEIVLDTFNLNLIRSKEMCDRETFQNRLKEALFQSV